MARSRSRRRYSRALTTIINAGAGGLSPVLTRSVMAANRFYVFGAVTSLPWVAIIALADAPMSLAPALTHLTMICVWVICIDLNRRRHHTISAVVGLSLPIVQFAYLSWVFSNGAGFALPLLTMGALAFVTVPATKWVLSSALTCAATLTLVRVYVTDIYDRPTADVSGRWLAWVTVGNIFVVVAIVSVVAMFNNSYFVRERLRNERLLAEARVAARTDALTEVLNRRGVAPLMSEVVRAGPFAFALADLDRFKRINDRLGHGAGDVVLSNVARTLVDSVGTRGTVARWGGEEFLIVMPGMSLEGAVALMEHARRSMEHEYGVDAFLEPVTISVGVAHAERNSSKEEVLRLADAKLYEAKASGRNVVVGGSLPVRDQQRA